MNDAATLEEPLRVDCCPYKPRRHFIPLHQSPKRWIYVVAPSAGGQDGRPNQSPYSRCPGKSAHRSAAQIRLCRPVIRPDQGLWCWSYLKHYTENVPGIRALEGELALQFFPWSATIRLYGGALAYERMRGIYLDGAVLDEYPLLNPRAWTSVVRPCLADYRGFAIVSGTSNGDDHFHSLKLKAEDDPAWDVFDIKITDTGSNALLPIEVEEMRNDMTADEFAREMLNSFEAPVEGAYYTEALNALQLQNRVTKVRPDLIASVITAWDLGMRHLQVVWLFQIAGRELHWIDYIEGRGKALAHYTDLLGVKAKAGGFRYKAHLLPHDVEVRELATGHSRRHELVGLARRASDHRSESFDRGWDRRDARGVGRIMVRRGGVSARPGAACVLIAAASPASRSPTRPRMRRTLFGPDASAFL